MLDFPLITTDSHFPAPLALAEKLPERYRSDVPRLDLRDDGAYLVRPLPFLTAEMDEMGMGSSGNNVTDALAKGIRVDPDDEVEIARILQGNCCDEARPGFSVESRLEEMERDGVVGELLIRNLFGGPKDPEGDLLWCQIQNDWAAAVFKDDFGAFAPSIVLPFSDIGAAAVELERAAALGLRPGLLPYFIPGHSFAHPEWEPLWQAAERAQVPLAFHVNGRGEFNGSSKVPTNLPGTHLTMMNYLFAATTETLGALVNGGVFERHPDLQVGLIETGAGWLSWFMESSDYYHGSRYSTDPARSLRAQMGVEELELAPPSYYIRRNVRCSFMYDPSAIRNRHLTGLRSLMWGNDYPHAEGLFPNSRAINEKQFDGVSPGEIMAIVHDNAAEYLGLTV
ncbi:MAG: hypothetical protein QOE97_1957 [Pseudonocardiales bacterium]|jgi:predicted TIM-barrel fold metal-dependent hydrolase|nr:hypothetical protein [Pseudonocardiales bacterium]